MRPVPSANTRWSFEADYLQACNCDFGCPCNFNGYPTHGNCEAIWGYAVKKGTFGATKLDGVTFAAAAQWPKAIHEGNGVGALYVDTKATPDQRQAVEAIFSGKHGGGVFEIFPKTWSKVHPTKVTRVELRIQGKKGTLKVEGVGEASSEPIKNPVTGEDFDGSIVLPKGIGWKQAVPTSVRFWVRDDDVLMRHENRAGFVTTLKVGNEGPL